MNGRFAGVIGFPVAHSYSPRMQEAGFSALGLDWRYGAFPVEPRALEAAIRGARALGFVGLNVTVPHKEAALLLCRPDDEARAVGAVNTLVFDGADLPRGLNTDLHGFRCLLDENHFAPARARAVILGAGGAARAVAFALLDGGCAVTVVSRSARRVVFPGGAPGHGGGNSGIAHVAWTPDALRQALAGAALLVDATPRGLSPAPHAATANPPAGSAAPPSSGAPLDPVIYFAAMQQIDLGALPASALVVDLAVRPSTPLVADARARGLHAVTGEAMLLHQGARALEAWTGRPAPLDAMRAALGKALRSG